MAPVPLQVERQQGMIGKSNYAMPRHAVLCESEGKKARWREREGEMEIDGIDMRMAWARHGDGKTVDAQDRGQQ